VIVHVELSMNSKCHIILYAEKNENNEENESYHCVAPLNKA